MRGRVRRFPSKQAQWTALHVVTAAHSKQLNLEGEEGQQELATKIEIVKLLISNGANVNAKTRVSAANAPH